MTDEKAKTKTITIAKHMNVMVRNKAGKLVQETREPGEKVAVDVFLLKQNPELDANWQGWGKIAAGEIAAEALAEARRDRGEPEGTRKLHRIAPAAARNRFLRTQSVEEPDQEVTNSKPARKKKRKVKAKE